MALVATATQTLSNLIKKYDSQNTELFNELVTVNEASLTTYKVGTVLGKITASGKYIVSKQAAVDGSQTPAAIVIGNSFGDAIDFSVPATTDTKVLVLARGKVVVSAAALFLDASFTAGALTTAAYAALKAQGIAVETNFS
jgi:hypothetical protein